MRNELSPTSLVRQGSNESLASSCLSAAERCPFCSFDPPYCGAWNLCLTVWALARARGGWNANSRSGATLEALEQQISDAGHDREILKGQVAERDHVIKNLRGQIQAQTSVLSEIRLAQANLENSLQRSEVEKQQRTAEEQKSAEERKSLDQKLETAEASLQKTQGKLDSLRRERSEEQQQATNLEAQITGMSRLLRDREQTIDRQEELLGHDRDIRDLMPETLWPGFLHQGKVFGFLRLRPRPPGRRQECHLPSLGPSRTGHPAGLEPGYLL